MSPRPPTDAEESHRTKGLLRLTMACNERCPFCNVPVEDYPRPTPDEAEIEARLHAFLESGERTLTISGGEPTLLRARLLRLIARARAAGVPFVELQTNAVLIDAAYAADLAGAGLTSAFVSLLSHEPAHHDALAGLPGAFPRCLAGIDALLDQGVRVTLNPVVARPTQALVPAYLAFVASRLPRVRSVSLSAVQPHGRAARDPALMPDYAVLARAVREGRRVAAAAGIELLNPYCGLPLCVGWEEGLEGCVEAVEAASGGPGSAPGVENEGDKRQGPACGDCALRTRCRGAWHAVWDERGGAGIAAPVRVRPPWEAGAEGAAGQCVDRPPRAEGEWTVWRRWDGREPVEVLLAGPWTDLALERPARDLDPVAGGDRALLRGLRRLQRENEGREERRRLRLWLRLTGTEEGRAEVVLELALALGVHRLDWPELPARARRVLGARFPGLLREVRDAA